MVVFMEYSLVQSPHSKSNQSKSQHSKSQHSKRLRLLRSEAAVRNVGIRLTEMGRQAKFATPTHARYLGER
jgi:hypothetical protein